MVREDEKYRYRSLAPDYIDFCADYITKDVWEEYDEKFCYTQSNSYAAWVTFGIKKFPELFEPEEEKNAGFQVLADVRAVEGLKGRASANGHIEIVRLLLQDPRVDPAAMNNKPMKAAARNGHNEVFALLKKDPRAYPSYYRETVHNACVWIMTGVYLSLSLAFLQWIGFIDKDLGLFFKKIHPP